MKLEEALLQLDEQELFGSVKSIPVELNEVFKNFVLLLKMIQETIDTLTNRDILLYEDAKQISNMQKFIVKNKFIFIVLFYVYIFLFFLIYGIIIMYTLCIYNL